MPGGPLIADDWLSMPDFVQRWYGSGATIPLVPDFVFGTGAPRPQSPRIQVPAVVPQSAPDFTNTSAPPLIPIGVPVVPTSGVFQSEPELEEEVALSDWIQGGIDIANAWGQQPVWQAPAQFAGASVPSTPAATAAGTANGLPAGMYMDKHGHLVHRRRRRRPCITQTDLSMAWQISNLPNNANVKMFLAKCVR